MLLEEIFKEAKLKALESWRENGVFEEVIDKGQKCVPTCWILSMKDTPEDLTPKARLVAKGFKEVNIEEIPNDSPRCTKESFRLVLAPIVQNSWKSHSMDIKTALLQGHLLERNVYVKPPADMKL